MDKIDRLLFMGWIFLSVIAVIALVLSVSISAYQFGEKSCVSKAHVSFDEIYMGQ